MSYANRQTVTATGVAFILALLASFAVFVAPADATPQYQLRPDSRIDIGDIDVVYEGSGASVEGGHLDSEDWAVFNGFIDEVEVLAHIDLFTPNEHIELLLVRVLFPGTGCVVILHQGHDLESYLIDHVAGDIYHASIAAGHYDFEDCTPEEEDLVDEELHGSPSLLLVLITFEIAQVLV